MEATTMDKRTLETLTFFPVTREMAWRRYLAQTRAAALEEYAEVEQAAWGELQHMLAQLEDPVPAA